MQFSAFFTAYTFTRWAEDFKFNHDSSTWQAKTQNVLYLSCQTLSSSNLQLSAPKTVTSRLILSNVSDKLQSRVETICWLAVAHKRTKWTISQARLSKYRTNWKKDYQASQLSAMANIEGVQIWPKPEKSGHNNTCHYMPVRTCQVARFDIRFGARPSSSRS